MAKKKKITGGLYEGDTGAYQADKDPLGFYNFTLANEGRTAANTSPWGWNFLQNQGFQNIYDQYMNAQGVDKNLQFMTYLGNRYGVSPSMSARNPYAGNSVLG